MSVANTSLRVADLDFNSIRTNLRNYLKGQTEFTDYDFEGSGMSVLLDLLAYNTYYNSFYLNMAANEAFIDTAQIRNNVLSHAKVVNYVPTSRRGALAKINLKATPSGTEDATPTIITLKKYTRLQGAGVDGVSYPFVTINANTASKVNGAFSFSNVMIKQGEVVTQQYLMEANNSLRKFEIPSANLDSTTLTITVQESSTNTYTREFFLSSDITSLTGNSFVYFLEENENLNYSLYFGDGILGYKPKIGNIVVATYLETLGAVANNVSRFSFIDPIGGYYTGNVVATTVSSSYSGQEKETIDQIRFRAPYSYTAQNRAVTVDDYKSLILKDYPNVEAVTIWGGEDNDPVVYGKVFISLKTKGYYSLSNLEKENIKNQLINTRNVLTVTPEIVDPEYIFVQIRGKVTYNSRLTTKDTNQILSTIKAAIQSYSNEEMNKFDSTFRKSKLQYYIEQSDPSITGSDIQIFLQKQVPITVNQSKNYTIKFNAALQKGSHPTERLYSYPEISIIDSANITRKVFFEEIPDSFTGVGSVDMISGGSNYSSNTSVVINGDGIGAKAKAFIIGGRVTSITVTNPGSNYTIATATIIDDTGTGATASVKLNSQSGVLRTYYFKSNGEKVIVNDSAGTISYDKGTITLTSLLATNVTSNDFYETNVLALNAVPEEEIITPLRNRILTIDQSIIPTVQLEVVPEA
jgi:hypothetical protein